MACQTKHLCLKKEFIFIKIMFSETDVKFMMFVLNVDASGLNFEMFRIMDSM